MEPHPYKDTSACLELTSNRAEVAREVIDGLVASGKHEILLFSRRVSSRGMFTTG
jgi:hypothetical protein